jgi:argininosuccinate lyase
VAGRTAPGGGGGRATKRLHTGQSRQSVLAVLLILAGRQHIVVVQNLADLRTSSLKRSSRYEARPFVVYLLKTEKAELER